MFKVVVWLMINFSLNDRFIVISPDFCRVFVYLLFSCLLNKILNKNQNVNVTKKCKDAQTFLQLILIF